jgi:zinc-ribbon domain
MTPGERGTAMSTTFCSNCGAALTPGSQFCAYCGSPAPNMGAAGPTAPLASGGPPPPPMPPYPQMEPSGGYRPRQRRGLVIAVVVVLLVAIIGGVVFYELSTAPNVDINVFIFWAPDNVCGLNEPNNQLIYEGYNDSPGVTDYFQFQVPNDNNTTCTITSLITNTTGFSLANYQGPGPISAESYGYLNVNLTFPSSSWSGNVNFVVR